MSHPYTLKKSLGQHFLKDENVAKKIVNQIPFGADLQLLEVGSGGGALTKYLLKKEFGAYKAIEVDNEKVTFLLKHFPELSGKLINEDFLESEPPFQGDFMVIGNFPYNISGPILFKILEWEPQVAMAVGMFQREVARRVASKSGNKEYGILSVLLQAFYEVEYLFDVSPECFQPPPKVVSGVIKLTRTGNPYQIGNRKKFIQLVKGAFNQRRKMLRNTLKGFLPPDTLPESYASLRAEQLSVADFVKLYKTCFEHGA